MMIEDLLRVVDPPAAPMEKGTQRRWASLEKRLRIHLPEDYCEFGTRYGTGAFQDAHRLIIHVWNPFSIHYLHTVERMCDELRFARVLNKRPNVPYGVFPHKPGWLPLGNDIDGSLLCWLTEGEPDSWPIILLTPEQLGFQQLHLSMSAFLAKAFTRQIQLILWNDPNFFSGPEPVRFVPGK